jgi:epsilon-lactone hydrolase
VGSSFEPKFRHSLLLRWGLCRWHARHPAENGGTPGYCCRSTRARAELSARSRALLSRSVDDAVRAYQWLLERGTEPSNIVLSGDSVGGGLAVSTALAIRNQGLPRCASIAAISPWGDLTCNGKSMTSRADVDIECTRTHLLKLASSYLNGADPVQPLASPVFADLTGLPPLLCIARGDEELLDDSIRLVRNAGIARVNATLFIAAGMQHIFPIWAGAFPEADAAIVLMVEWVRTRICAQPSS